MDQSAFARLIRANPNKYRTNTMTLDPRWIKQQELKAELIGGLGFDYDYGMMFGGRGANGHGTDEGKLPWHPTFSNQSMFADKELHPGGIWSVNENGQDVFTPSARMWMQKGYPEMINRYMKRAEENVMLDRSNKAK